MENIISEFSPRGKELLWKKIGMLVEAVSLLHIVKVRMSGTEKR